MENAVVIKTDRLVNKAIGINVLRNVLFIGRGRDLMRRASRILRIFSSSIARSCFLYTRKKYVLILF